MKRLAPTLLALAVFLTLGSTKAWSQRSGTMQATAIVVDTRAAVSGLTAAQNLAAQWSADPRQSSAIDSGVAQVSLQTRRVSSAAERPESRLEIRVEYLRN